MVGAWLTDPLMYLEVTPAELPPVKLHLQEVIIVVASLMIQSPRDAKTVLVPVALIGMGANVWQVIIYPESPAEAVLVAVTVIPLPVHTSTVAPQAIIGMAQNVWQATIPVEAGQIQLPDPNPGVNHLQVAVALILIGIMAAVTAEAQALIMEVVVPHPAINARV